jgi:glycogen debranching enzyme
MCEDDKINASCDALRQKLEELNHNQYITVKDHLDKAIDNFVANARWRFVDPGGPRLPIVSEKEPLMYK